MCVLVVRARTIYDYGNIHEYAWHLYGFWVCTAILYKFLSLRKANSCVCVIGVRAISVRVNTIGIVCVLLMFGWCAFILSHNVLKLRRWNSYANKYIMVSSQSTQAHTHTLNSFTEWLMVDILCPSRATIQPSSSASSSPSLLLSSRHTKDVPREWPSHDCVHIEK